MMLQLSRYSKYMQKPSCFDCFLRFRGLGWKQVEVFGVHVAVQLGGPEATCSHVGAKFELVVAGLAQVEGSWGHLGFLLRDLVAILAPS